MGQPFPYIVTIDEMLFFYINVESKQQSMQWRHKICVDFMMAGTTITSQVYCGTLCKLHCAIQNQLQVMLKSGIVLLHNNTCPHLSALTIEIIQYQKCIEQNSDYVEK